MMRERQVEDLVYRFIHVLRLLPQICSYFELYSILVEWPQESSARHLFVDQLDKCSVCLLILARVGYAIFRSWNVGSSYPKQNKIFWTTIS